MEFFFAESNNPGLARSSSDVRTLSDSLSEVFKIAYRRCTLEDRVE
jgi:hypothetical protein